MAGISIIYLCSGDAHSNWVGLSGIGIVSKLFCSPRATAKKAKVAYNDDKGKSHFENYEEVSSICDNSPWGRQLRTVGDGNIGRRANSTTQRPSRRDALFNRPFIYV